MMIKATANSQTFQIGQNQEGNYFLEGLDRNFDILSISPFEIVLRNESQEYQILIVKSDHQAKKYKNALVQAQLKQMGGDVG